MTARERAYAIHYWLADARAFPGAVRSVGRRAHEELDVEPTTATPTTWHSVPRLVRVAAASLGPAWKTYRRMRKFERDRWPELRESLERMWTGVGDESDFATGGLVPGPPAYFMVHGGEILYDPSSGTVT